MHRQRWPSSRLIQSSPLVVPKYRPTGSRASARHRLALDRPPRLLARQANIEALPARSGVARAIDRGHAAGAGARPDAAAVHREHPGGVGVARVHHQRKADVADLLRHGLADAHPLVARPVEPVDAAMVLLVEAVGIARAQPHAVRVVEREIGRIEAFDHFEPFHQGCEAAAAVTRFVHAAARHREVQVRGIARIDDDRMQLRPVRRAVLHRAHPLAVLRVVVDRGERLPGEAAVLGAEQALRRGAGVPDTRLGGVARGQPEGVIDGAAVLGLGEGGRPRRLLPVATEIVGAEHRRPEVAGLRRRQQRAPVARVEHEMADDVAEEVRPVGPPCPSRGIAVIEPGALARGDQQDDRARLRSA